MKSRKSHAGSPAVCPPPPGPAELANKELLTSQLPVLAAPAFEWPLMESPRPALAGVKVGAMSFWDMQRRYCSMRRDFFVSQATHQANNPWGSLPFLHRVKNHPKTPKEDQLGTGLEPETKTLLTKRSQASISRGSLYCQPMSSWKVTQKTHSPQSLPNFASL